MRGADGQTAALFSHVSCEARVPADHPLRLIRAVVDEALEALAGEFEGLYARVGRPSIAPEKLLRASLLQALHSVRSERALMERLDRNLLFRWFVGLPMDAPVWDASTFGRNRDRLLAGDVAQAFLAAVVAQPRVAALVSSEHFSVESTLVGAWASHKSSRPKGEDGAPPDPPASGPGGGRDAEADWRGRKRSNETHASTTDPDARLARRADGQSSIVACAGHVLMENRNGLVRMALATRASGIAEREAALGFVDRLTGGCRQRLTLGADKSYDTRDFVAGLRARRATPHAAQDDHPTKTDARHRPHRPHRPPPGLRAEPDLPQAHRGGLRLARDGCHPAPDPPPRPAPRRLVLHPRGRRLQPRPASATAATGDVNGAATAPPCAQ